MTYIWLGISESIGEMLEAASIMGDYVVWYIGARAKAKKLLGNSLVVIWKVCLLKQFSWCQFSLASLLFPGKQLLEGNSLAKW